MASTALPQKSQPTRMRAETRRNQIVEVAAELFASRGFSGTTTKEIAEGAGVSEAIIFRHFASKDQLYAAILDHKVKQGTERLKAQMEEAASRKDDRAFALYTELREQLAPTTMARRTEAERAVRNFLAGTDRNSGAS